MHRFRWRRINSKYVCLCRYTLRHYYEVEPADVISSSFSPILTPAETFAHKDLLDGFASKYTKTTYVIAAGNDGPAANTVCHLGLSYNAITVGALGNPNNFDTAAGFSSRGASNFYNPYTDETIEGVRATIDITASGENILLANYVASNPSENYLRVNFDEMIYGETENNSETYALAWKLNVPKPADYTVVCAMLALLFAIATRARKSSGKF